ncbi:siphovirus Gp157 family protein [Salmonella enterica subsp. enterica]|nr:siphovirus Gp157 family protein [Salmonella enterica subsp. enterica]
MSTAIAIAKDYASLLDLLETSDELTPEMIADTLEGIEGELGDKLDAMMVICRNLLGNASVCAEEMERLTARKKSFEGKENALRKHMLACLQAAGLDKLKTAKNTFTDAIGSLRVVIDNEDKIPDEYEGVQLIDVKTVITPNKKAIKEVIESAEATATEMVARGETPPPELLNPVPGAHLERGERSLRVR